MEKRLLFDQWHLSVNVTSYLTGVVTPEKALTYLNDHKICQLSENFLMCKWRPFSAPDADDWSTVTQVVVPTPYQLQIL